jgi:hypothetical protein
LFLILPISTARAQIFTPLPPEVWPPIVDTPLQISDILNELAYRNYQAAWRIAKDLAIIEARQQVHNYFKSKVKMTKLAADLNQIFDDPNRTLIEKEDDLLALTDASLEPTASPQSGALNVTMQHSIELGVTRLEWDDKVRTGSCSGGMVSANCRSIGGVWSCDASGSYSTVYYKSQPDYIIYRIVNGQETVISRLKGSLQNSGSPALTISDNLWKSSWSFAKVYYNSRGKPYRDVVPGRAFFYDFNADMHEPGQTLQYKVVVHDDWLMSPQICGAGTGSTIPTTVTADGDGNGRMDYLSNADYAKFFKKYYGWLPTVINSILE